MSAPVTSIAEILRRNLHRLKQPEAFLPFDNPTFHNPAFKDASYRVLIVRLSPFQDVDRSIPHLFLYHEVRQALADAYIDFAFFPGEVERELFDEQGIPYLVGIQSLCGPDAFDLILISNAYTLELINLPYLLIRAGVPLFSSQRGPGWPLLIMGGSNAAISQSIVRPDGDSLVDALYLGEGEGRVGKLVAALAQGGDARAALAQAAAQMEGLWVAGSGRTVVRAVLRTPNAQFLPYEYPLLNSPEVHTANLQITYGCPAFCTFCFEGYERKPYRELPLADLLVAARRIKRAQGVEEINLYSFNFNTHSDVLALMAELHRLFDRVGLKSQRADILQQVGGLLEAEVEADKRNFTLGIEGISERQRTWLHKSLDTTTIVRLLDRLFSLKIREVKLFYLLTGHEDQADMVEFREFVKQIKEIRRTRNSGIRLVFSFGLLIRMPFTPLQYDRLCLDEEVWRPLIGQAKSACETNGFEFRMAFDWAAYCTTQVLALGGHWLTDALVSLAREGHFFDTSLSLAYWDQLQGWMTTHGHWNDALLGEKGPDYAFPMSFIRPDISPHFLYCQYQEAKAGVDEGYCLGPAGDGRGRCLGCGACLDGREREAMTAHQIDTSQRALHLAHLRETMARKRRLKPAYYLLRLGPSLGGTLPAFLNAFAFKALLTQYPELLENLLSVRESLFTLRPNDRSYPTMGGESVFALKAWDLKVLQEALSTKRAGSVEVVGPAPGFRPGAFSSFHLDLRLPAGDIFAQPRRVLEAYLRDAYLPYSLRREEAGQGYGARYRFDVPPKGLKKKIVLGGVFEFGPGGFQASLDVGARFDLLAFLEAFGQRDLGRHAWTEVSDIRW